jgi:hypothetical protein
MSEDKWERPDAPPPAMFVGQPEREYQKQISDEVMEDIVGQQVLYFAVDIEKTKFHPLYKEAIVKIFLNPVRAFCSVNYSDEDSITDKYGIDRRSSIVVHFPARRLNEDQNVFVREGDFLFYNNEFHEIVKLGEPKELYGNINHKVEIVATCVKDRSGLRVSNRG